VTELTVEIADDGGQSVLALSGELDIDSVSGVRSTVQRRLEAGGIELLTVDLAGLTFIDSSGLHGLVTAHHAARARNGRVVVVNASGVVADVLDVTGVGELLRDEGLA
jgi:anti-sigma B factor antagonist